jgi:hypothetical protein
LERFDTGWQSQHGDLGAHRDGGLLKEGKIVMRQAHDLVL